MERLPRPFGARNDNNVFASRLAAALAFTIFCSLFIIHTLSAAPASTRSEIISIDRLAELQQTVRRDFILIDVEPKIAYDREHIDGAVNLPLEEIEARHKYLPKDKLIITYCHCGGESSRAKQAAEKLAGLKFKKVAYLGSTPSAFFEYKKSGLPMAVNLTRYIAIEQLYSAAGSPVFISTASAPHISPPASPGINPSAVPCEILYSRLKNHPEEVGKNFIVIDLREKEEYDAGHIPGAQNISLGKLLSKNPDGKFVYETLPRDKEIFVYCAGGYRSKIAAEELFKAGYGNIYSLDGGFSLWRKNNYEIEK